jgi:hypothetical protein
LVLQAQQAFGKLFQGIPALLQTQFHYWVSDHNLGRNNGVAILSFLKDALCVKVLYSGQEYSSELEDDIKGVGIDFFINKREIGLSIEKLRRLCPEQYLKKADGSARAIGLKAFWKKSEEGGFLIMFRI